MIYKIIGNHLDGFRALCQTLAVSISIVLEIEPPFEGSSNHVRLTVLGASRFQFNHKDFIRVDFENERATLRFTAIYEHGTSTGILFDTFEESVKIIRQGTFEEFFNEIQSYGLPIKDQIAALTMFERSLQEKIAELAISQIT